MISDAHQGLKAAMARVLEGPGWHICRVHLCATLAKSPEGHAEMVAATVRTVFAQPDDAAAREQLSRPTAVAVDPTRQAPGGFRLRGEVRELSTQVHRSVWIEIGACQSVTSKAALHSAPRSSQTRYVPEAVGGGMTVNWPPCEPWNPMLGFMRVSRAGAQAPSIRSRS